jgi:hypothetical protein
MANKASVLSDATVTADELTQVDQAYKTGNTPVVFVVGLWLLPSSRDRWKPDPDAKGG